LRDLAGAPVGETELVLKKGEDERRLRAVFISFAPGEGSPPGRIILLEDVTEIVRSGRLAAWAEMARRIAHEIKNPLTPIQLSVEHVRRLLGAKDPRFEAVLAECLDNIQRQVRVLRQIASEFSAYARLPQLKAEPTPVEQIIEDALRPYATAPPDGVSLERDVPAGVPDVLADRAILSRALVNVIENALQAMTSGGTLRVSASTLDVPGGKRLVRIDVRDTGPGMDPEIQQRLFEPYFSTKIGGTGLGLSIARRAVEEHGGTIQLHSSAGEGTVVSLTLPVAPASRPGIA
jgi:two-component system, NtrC family, nitrogen regulation sensor histidine kinase NtrY